MATDTGWRTFHATGGRWGYETGTYGYRSMVASSGRGPRVGNTPTAATRSSLPSVASMSGFAESTRALSRMAGALKPGAQAGQRAANTLASIKNKYGVTTPSPAEALEPPKPPTPSSGYGSSVQDTPFWKAGPQSTIPGTPTLSRNASFAYPGSQPVAGVPAANPKPGIRGWAERFAVKTAARPSVRMAGAVASALLED